MRAVESSLYRILSQELSYDLCFVTGSSSTALRYFLWLENNTNSASFNNFAYILVLCNQMQATRKAFRGQFKIKEIEFISFENNLLGEVCREQ